MEISLEQIKSLRERTGVSMTAIKNALVEANGDEEKAIEILRKKGEAKAAERADRATANGVVGLALGSGAGALVALGCETDFVAKNEDFVMAANKLAERILAEGESTDLSAELSELNIKMGEKVEVVQVKKLEASVIGSYVHSNLRIGVLVAADGVSQEVAQDVALHIAASRPTVISPEEISGDLVAKEKDIWTEQLKNEGKPAEIIEKIMMGKEKKFREEWALLTQPFVKNPEQMVGSLLGSGKVLEFARFEV